MYIAVYIQYTYTYNIDTPNDQTIFRFTYLFDILVIRLQLVIKILLNFKQKSGLDKT